jgi:hypothetical protein
MNKRKLLKKLLAGSRNIRFGDLTRLVEAFGFELARVTGGHHIFTHPEIPRLINLQNVQGQAKPYQIGQFLDLIEEYRLDLGDDE